LLRSWFGNHAPRAGSRGANRPNSHEARNYRPTGGSARKRGRQSGAFRASPRSGVSVRDEQQNSPAAASGSAPGPLRRLHVVGCPRSGTTLVAELVATCFADVGHDEHELSIFRPAPRTFPVYVSKKPMDVKRVAPLLRADPHLYVIGVHRDPRAVITSEIAAEGRYRSSYDRRRRR